jgi:hypothetical protein
VPIALLAVVVAIGSLAVAWRALDRAGDARDIALRAGPAPGGAAASPAPQPPPQPAETTEATETPDGSQPSAPPTLNPQTAFVAKYDSTEMQVQASCNAPRYLDMDRPQVDAGTEGYDLALRAPCSQTDGFALGLGEDVKAIKGDNPDLTPNECWSKISLSAVAPQSDVAIKQGSVLCVWTSLTAAKTRSELSDLVVLQVRGVASDGTVTMQVKAWQVPL